MSNSENILLFIRYILVQEDCPPIEGMPPTLFRFEKRGDLVFEVTDPTIIDNVDYPQWGRVSMDFFQKGGGDGFFLCAIIETDDGEDKLLLAIFTESGQDVQASVFDIALFKSDPDYAGDIFNILEHCPDFGVPYH